MMTSLQKMRQELREKFERLRTTGSNSRKEKKKKVYPFTPEGIEEMVRDIGKEKTLERLEKWEKYVKERKKSRFSNKREKYRLLTDEMAWKAAEKFLRKYGYNKVTVDIMDSVLPEWRTTIEELPTFEEKVRYVIHEAVEIEEVYRALGRWVEPRLAGERELIDLMPLHLKAETLSSRYVPKGIPRERYGSKQFKRRSVRDVIENPREDEFYVLVMRYVPME